MSTLSSSGVVRVGAAIRTVSRRLRRFAFRYDALELRQLLSVGQTAAAANPIVVQPAISATPLFGSSIPTGFSPSQVQSAYGVNQISFGNVTGNGAGQTIAIIDAYFDPNIASDLQKFDSQYGLQAPPSFTQYVQNGFLPTDAGLVARNGARRGMGARDGAGGQYRAGRSAADAERSFQRGQLRQPSAGRLGRLDELGRRRVRRRIGL